MITMQALKLKYNDMIKTENTYGGYSSAKSALLDAVLHITHCTF